MDCVLAIADRDVTKYQPRRRQEARIDVSGHAYTGTYDATCLCFKERAMAGPVDQKWANQRSNERQNDRDRKSKQGGLQCQLQRRTPAGARPRRNMMKCTPFLAMYGGESMS